MDKTKLQTYLHEHIPLSAAMQSRIDVLEPGRVILSAPLAPNINHRQTVFGGSASALATLAAWTLVHNQLTGNGIHARLVIQKHCMSYDKPITDHFQAVCILPERKLWERFMSMLHRRGRGRIHLNAQLTCHAETVGQFEGDFVAIKT